MGQKVYVVVRVWDDIESIKAVFSTHEAARAYMNSRPGEWDCYEMDLDVEKPDDSMKLWRVSIMMEYNERSFIKPPTTDEHLSCFELKENAFFFADHEDLCKYFCVDVKAKTRSEAIDKGQEILETITNNMDRYSHCMHVRFIHFWHMGNHRYDFPTGNKI